MWKRTTEKTYDDMLNILPPAAWTSFGFLVGEAWRHQEDGSPAYQAFVKLCGKFYVNSEPMTVREFKALKPGEVFADLVLQ